VSAHDWFTEHRAEFATGTLAGDEALRFADHLEHCEECRQAVAQLEHDLRWLPMGATPMAPPPGLTRRLTEGVLDRGPRRRPWLMPTALAASIALTALVAWQSRRDSSRLHAEVERLRAEAAATDARLAATLDTLSVIRSATRIMQAKLEMAGERAGLVIFEDAATHRWTVVVHGLPEPPAGQRFALWFECEDGMREGTALPQTMEGTAVLVVPMPQDLGTVMAASITQETMPVTPGAMPEKKTELLHLKL